jgi:hypothetical protein
VQPTAADALMAMVYRQTGNYPETLLEEINGNVLEQNFWAGIASGWQKKTTPPQGCPQFGQKAAN